MQTCSIRLQKLKVSTKAWKAYIGMKCELEHNTVHELLTIAPTALILQTFTSLVRMGS